MDFSTFDTKSAADQGATLHFTHPVLGHYLYDGPGAGPDGSLVDASKKHTPVTAVVRGYHAPKVQGLIDRTNRSRMERQSEAEQKAFAAKLIDTLIVSWEGITRDGKPLECTAENKAWLTETNHEIFKQIDEFAKDQGNFFGSNGSA